MDSNQNSLSKEHIIDLKDFCWLVLGQWKAIILVALCVMLAFLGLMSFRQTKALKEQDSQYSAQNLSEQDILNTLPDNEQSVVASTYRLLQERDKLSNYICSAPIMEIDPNQAQRLRVSWAVDEKEIDSNTLAMTYLMELKSTDCVNRLIQASGTSMDVGHFSDLVFFTFPEKIGEGVVCCDVFLTDEMQGEKLQSELNNEIQSIFSRMQSEFGQHRLINYKSEITQVADDRVLQRQTTLLNNFANFNNQINSLKNMFSLGQKEALGKLQEIGNGQTIKAPKRTRVVTLRNILIGLVLGGFIYLVFCLLAVMASGKVFGESMIKGTPARLLGQWDSLFKDSAGNWLVRDKWLWNKQHRNHQDKNVELERATETIESVCVYKNINQLLMFSTAKQTVEQKKFVDELNNRIEAAGLRVMYAEYNDGNSIQDRFFKDNDGVILYLFDSKTHFRDIETIVNRCNDYNKPILGSIYLS